MALLDRFFSFCIFLPANPNSYKSAWSSSARLLCIISKFNSVSHSPALIRETPREPARPSVIPAQGSQSHRLSQSRVESVIRAGAHHKRRRHIEKQPAKILPYSLNFSFSRLSRFPLKRIVRDKIFTDFLTKLSAYYYYSILKLFYFVCAYSNMTAGKFALAGSLRIFMYL